MFQQIFISIYRQKILCAKIDNKKKTKTTSNKKKRPMSSNEKDYKKKKKTTNTINYKKMKMLN